MFFLTFRFFSVVIFLYLIFFLVISFFDFFSTFIYFLKMIIFKNLFLCYFDCNFYPLFLYSFISKFSNFYFYSVSSFIFWNLQLFVNDFVSKLFPCGKEKNVIGDNFSVEEKLENINFATSKKFRSIYIFMWLNNAFYFLCAFVLFCSFFVLRRVKFFDLIYSCRAEIT